MAGLQASPAKAILLAVQLASKVDTVALETLISKHRKTLHTELVLRIILSFLPESTESQIYVPLLERLSSGDLVEDAEFDVSKYALDEVSEADAKKKARKLHLLHLNWPYEITDEPPSALVRFLVLRSLRIDENTGLITQLPELLGPFLHYSIYLRTWMISTILPLLRFDYEYYTGDSSSLTLSAFERLDDEDGVKLLLSRTSNNEDAPETSVGRDLRGLVGAWMYGDTRWKRRKSRMASQATVQAIAQLGDNPVANEKCVGWEEVFTWMSHQAGSSWRTVVNAIEQWDGPGDVDVGEYSDGTEWLDEDEQQYLERRYARTILGVAYLVSEESEEALAGVYGIVERIVTLLDEARIPTLQAAAALLTPVSDLDESILSQNNAVYLRNTLLGEDNPLTKPSESPIRLLQTFALSAYLCTRVGLKLTTRRTGELALLQNEREQQLQFSKLMNQIGNGPKGDDKYWMKLRNEIIWLRSWGAEELSEGADAKKGRGIFGSLSKDFVEAEFLKLLLTNTRYTLARSIYEISPDRPIAKEVLVDTIIAAAMNAYDNATNSNKTRGGMKKCRDILNAFPDTLMNSINKQQTEHLVNVTHELGEYRLVFKQNEPFRPVNLRVHGDPISLIGTVLQQNPKSYGKIKDFIGIGKGMVNAGLVLRDVNGISHVVRPITIKEQLGIAEKRVISMCIDAALAEDDFETAYSYVVNFLKKVAAPALSSTETGSNDTGLTAEVPAKVIDDWSWRAALQAGKYRRTEFTVRPSHLGNTSGNPEIRHLDHRIECLSYALRFAPKATLQEILNIYRRCEEELETHMRREAEQEAAWDAQGDEQVMPGAFQETPKNYNTTANANATSRVAEEEPVSLFDLSRASMARAQTALSVLKSAGAQNSDLATINNNDGDRDHTIEGDTMRVRKRDQLKNAAVGSFAQGIGWLINAPAPTDE